MKSSISGCSIIVKSFHTEIFQRSLTENLMFLSVEFYKIFIIKQFFFNENRLHIPIKFSYITFCFRKVNIVVEPLSSLWSYMCYTCCFNWKLFQKKMLTPDWVKRGGIEILLLFNTLWQKSYPYLIHYTAKLHVVTRAKVVRGDTVPHSNAKQRLSFFKITFNFITCSHE